VPSIKLHIIQMWRCDVTAQLSMTGSKFWGLFY
jgi:hypothetical protein